MMTVLLACSGSDGFDSLRDGELGSIPYASENFETIWPDAEFAMVRPARGLPSQAEDVLVLGTCERQPELLWAAEGPGCAGSTLPAVWSVVEEVEGRCLYSTPATASGRLALAAESCVEGGQVLAAPEGALHVIHLSDVHQTECSPDERAVEVLELADSRQADLLVITGDLVENGPRSCQWTALAEIIDGLDTPVMTVPGNHDYEHGGRDGDDDPHAGLQHYMGTMGPLLSPRLRLGELGVFGLDTGTSTSSTSWLAGKLITTRGLTDGQVADVSSWAGEAPAQLLLGHAPFRTSAFGMGQSGHSERSGAMQDRGEELEQVLLQSDVLALFGHTHVNEAWVAGQDQFERRELAQPDTGAATCPEALRGTWMLTTQAATKDYGWGDRGEGYGFRELFWTDGTWSTRSVRLPGRVSWPACQDG